VIGAITGTAARVAKDSTIDIALIILKVRSTTLIMKFLSLRRIPQGLLAILFSLAGANAADLKIPDDVLFESGIEFSNADGQHLQLDLARPKSGEGLRPAIICIHGGGFRAGTRDGYDSLCIRLAREGYVAVTITYRLAPAYKFPAAVQDCKTAARWLRANASTYHIDTDRIGAMGGSAGGHLALFLGVTPGVGMFEAGEFRDQSSAVSCVVSYFGPSDLTKSYGKSVDAHEVLPLFFGGNLEEKRREHVLGSPLNWVNPLSAPVLCIHGTRDTYVALEQATWIVDRLKSCAVEADLLVLEGAGHGFKDQDAEKAEAAMVSFFARHLKPSSSLKNEGK
jgi:acetyl esterase/lipase